MAYILAGEEPEATPIGTQYDNAEIKEELANILAGEEPEATPIGTQYDNAEIKEELANILAGGEPEAAYPNAGLEALMRPFE